MPGITLTPAQRKALVASKEQLDAVEREIMRAKRAGLDTAELEARLAEARQLRDGLLREYGGVA